MGKLEGKTVIITGAGTGIGKGIARAFADEGATLVAASRNKESLDIAAEEFRANGTTVVVEPTDVTDEEQVMTLFERTVEKFGGLDVLVNNSGVLDGGPLDELSVETWKKVLDVNLTGAFLCTREAMKIMKGQGRGRIINIGSAAGLTPRENSAAYATSKAGLIGLTKVTALEGRPFGIAASCIHPGNVTIEKLSPGHAPAHEPKMTTDELATVILTMASLPDHVNLFESVVLPVAMPFIGRG